MADLKISQLTSATTPLAGTETVPIVQSGTTKKVTIADLTAGRAVSAASLTLTGALSVGGQTTETRAVSSSTFQHNWTDNGGANNSYMSFYNASDAWLYAHSKNGTGTNKPVRWSINDYGDSTTGVQLWLETNGSVCAGLTARATNATAGFLYIPTCAGTPTGTPTTQAGYAPLVIDSTNNKLYYYSGGWKALTGV